MKLFLDMKYYAKQHSDKNLVVYQVKGLPYLIARRYVKPKSSQQNKKMGGYAKNLAKMYKLLPQEQIRDLHRINRKLRLRSIYIVFYKLMFAFKKQVTNIELATISFQQIISNWDIITIEYPPEKN